jgi:hypothetical protein
MWFHLQFNTGFSLLELGGPISFFYRIQKLFRNSEKLLEAANRVKGVYISLGRLYALIPLTNKKDPTALTPNKEILS